MHLVYLSLGANCGTREQVLEDVLRILSSEFRNLTHSGLYETPDYHGGPRCYVNAVVKAYTSLSPQSLECRAKELELRFGRTPEARLAGDVPLDIDLVVYDNTIVKPRDFNRSFFSFGYSKLQENNIIE